MLVAEDDAAGRYLLEVRLREQGCTVGLAADGEQVLDMLAAAPWDVILLDAGMPRMDGLTVLERIRAGQSAGPRQQAVIVHSAGLAPGEEARLLFLLGEGGLGAGKAAKARWTPERADEDFARLAKFWDRKLSCLQVSTPNEGMNTELTSGTSIRARSTSCSPASPRSSRSAGALASATVTQRRTR